jgi:hypothetical protein
MPAVQDDGLQPAHRAVGDFNLVSGTEIRLERNYIN